MKNPPPALKVKVVPKLILPQNFCFVNAVLTIHNDGFDEAV
jgi:hypothetical protein